MAMTGRKLQHPSEYDNGKKAYKIIQTRNLPSIYAQVFREGSE